MDVCFSRVRACTRWVIAWQREAATWRGSPLLLWLALGNEKDNFFGKTASVDRYANEQGRKWKEKYVSVEVPVFHFCSMSRIPATELRFCNKEKQINLTHPVQNTKHRCGYTCKYVQLWEVRASIISSECVSISPIKTCIDYFVNLIPSFPHAFKHSKEVLTDTLALTDKFFVNLCE